MRLWPQPEFSLAMRTTSFLMVFITPLRPGSLVLYVHLSAIRRRCQRSDTFATQTAERLSGLEFEVTWVDTVERHGERCAVLQTLLSHEFDLEASELSGEFGDLEISVDLSWGQETCVSLEARRVLGNELTFAVTQTLDTVLKVYVNDVRMAERCGYDWKRCTSRCFWHRQVRQQ